MNTEKENFNNEIIEREVSPEFLEKLEKSPFSPQDQIWILLTKASLKPASWPSFVIKNESDGIVNKNLSEKDVHDAILLIQESFFCSFERKSFDIKQTKMGKQVGGDAFGPKIGEEENINFMIGSSEENFKRLVGAVEREDDKEIGLALGYVPTAVEAYCGSGEILDINILPKEVLSRDAMAFNPGTLSIDHWQEELAQYQKWADYVKKTSPILYNRMLDFMKK